MSSTRGLIVMDLNDELTTLAAGSPSRIVGLVNEDCLKLSIYEGEGSWHAHPSTDELFLVLEGELQLDIFRGDTVVIGPRQLVTVPAGVVHRPRSSVRSVILCFKPSVSPTEHYEVEAAAAAQSSP